MGGEGDAMPGKKNLPTQDKVETNLRCPSVYKADVTISVTKRNDAASATGGWASGLSVKASA